MIDPQVAWDKLLNFDTAQELREYFQFEGVKGFRISVTECPIANWMTATTGLFTTVSGSIRVWVDANDSRNPMKSPVAEFSHTNVTKNFVKSFDQKKYPELSLTDVIS